MARTHLHDDNRLSHLANLIAQRRVIGTVSKTMEAMLLFRDDLGYSELPKPVEEALGNTLTAIGVLGSQQNALFSTIARLPQEDYFFDHALIVRHLPEDINQSSDLSGSVIGALTQGTINIIRDARKQHDDIVLTPGQRDILGDNIRTAYTTLFSEHLARARANIRAIRETVPPRMRTATFKKKSKEIVTTLAKQVLETADNACPKTVIDAINEYRNGYTPDNPGVPLASLPPESVNALNRSLGNSLKLTLDTHLQTVVFTDSKDLSAVAATMLTVATTELLNRSVPGFIETRERSITPHAMPVISLIQSAYKDLVDKEKYTTMTALSRQASSALYR